MHLKEILSYLVRFPSEKINAYPVSDLLILGEVNASLVMPVGDRLQVVDTPSAQCQKIQLP